MNSTLFKLLLNVYPPYWGTGIVVRKVSPNWKEIIVQMKMRWYNRNYVNTHFGGSLYAMTDPFFMVMLIKMGLPKNLWVNMKLYSDFSTDQSSVTYCFEQNQCMYCMEYSNTKM